MVNWSNTGNVHGEGGWGSQEWGSRTGVGVGPRSQALAGLELLIQCLGPLWCGAVGWEGPARCTGAAVHRGVLAWRRVSPDPSTRQDG